MVHRSFVSRRRSSPSLYDPVDPALTWGASRAFVHHMHSGHPCVLPAFFPPFCHPVPSPCRRPAVTPCSPHAAVTMPSPPVSAIPLPCCSSAASPCCFTVIAMPSSPCRHRHAVIAMPSYPAVTIPSQCRQTAVTPGRHPLPIPCRHVALPSRFRHTLPPYSAATVPSPPAVTLPSLCRHRVLSPQRCALRRCVLGGERHTADSSARS